MKPPSFKHASEAQAIAEAERLARIHTGSRFYVLHATEMRQVDSMKRIVLKKFDDIPF
jgi:hypothetical protein